jgi:hypothetical protein
VYDGASQKWQTPNSKQFKRSKQLPQLGENRGLTDASCISKGSYDGASQKWQTPNSKQFKRPKGILLNNSCNSGKIVA